MVKNCPKCGSKNTELIGLIVYTARELREKVGIIGGTRISNLINGIYQIITDKATKLFYYESNIRTESKPYANR